MVGLSGWYLAMLTRSDVACSCDVISGFFCFVVLALSQLYGCISLSIRSRSVEK